MTEKFFIPLKKLYDEEAFVPYEYISFYKTPRGLEDVVKWLAVWLARYGDYQIKKRTDDNSTKYYLPVKLVSASPKRVLGFGLAKNSWLGECYLPDWLETAEAFSKTTETFSKILYGDCLEWVKLNTKLVYEGQGYTDDNFDTDKLNFELSLDFILPAEVVVEPLQAKGFDLIVEICKGTYCYETCRITPVKATKNGYVRAEIKEIYLVVELKLHEEEFLGVASLDDIFTLEKEASTETVRTTFIDTEEIHLEMALDAKDEQKGAKT